jgi:mono/diheme cytochrome c family protein
MSKKRVAVVALVSCAFAGSARAQSSERTGAREERGQYLVEAVGMCQDCHSPRDTQGAFVQAQWLGGAPIGFSPLSAMPWAEMAPPIAGLPTMSHQQGVHFLMSGQKPDGSRARPPMPEYRFSRDDAEAVVAYLRSLKPPE